MSDVAAVPETAPSATETADRPGGGVGACTCGAEGPEGCTCEIGQLARDLQRYGWEMPDPVERAAFGKGLALRALPVLHRARVRAITAARDSWLGSQEELAGRLGFSAGRLRQLKE